ncbi:MAG: TIGR02757 family protein [bacterium]
MKKRSREEIKKILDEALAISNRPVFIDNDPISIPHRFELQQDIEIAGFFAAVFSWGNRTTIINKCNELIGLMENTPYQFIVGHKEKELKRFLDFKHRTFNATDILHFIRFLNHHYTIGYKKLGGKTASLESAFTFNMKTDDGDIENALVGFHDYFFSLEDSPSRTKKHIPTPRNNSSCKRLNMYLRWMVRKDQQGVDFGLWKKIRPSQLVCPLDVHVQRTAQQLKLINSDKADWKTARELTQRLKEFDAHDPVKYDIALFSLGVNKIQGTRD